MRFITYLCTWKETHHRCNDLRLNNGLRDSPQDIFRTKDIGNISGRRRDDTPSGTTNGVV